MSNCNAAATLMDTNINFSRDDGVSKPVGTKHYQSLIGSLLYVVTATRLDIAEAVGELSNYNAPPTEAHLDAAKRLLHYRKCIPDAKLSYNKTGKLHGYSDLNWAGVLVNRRSTSGHVFLLGGRVGGGAISC